MGPALARRLFVSCAIAAGPHAAPRPQPLPSSIVRNRPVAANVKARSTGAQIGRGCLFGILLLAAVAAVLFGLAYLSGR